MRRGVVSVISNKAALGSSNRRSGAGRSSNVQPGPPADRVLLAHMGDCLATIHEDTGHERARFQGSRLVQDAVIRNLQTLAESSLPPAS